MKIENKHKNNKKGLVKTNFVRIRDIKRRKNFKFANFILQNKLRLKCSPQVFKRYNERNAS